MTGKFYRGALILVALGSFASVPMLNAQTSPAGNVRDAIVHAKESVTHLTEAIEDGKAGHAHTALTHLNAVSTLPSSVRTGGGENPARFHIEEKCSQCAVEFIWTTHDSVRMPTLKYI